jgi:hypothetical protein
LAAALVSVAVRPVGPESVTPLVAVLLLGAASLLLVGLPALYLVQADASGVVGLLGHALLSVGLLLLVLVSAAPLLYSDDGVVAPEDAVLFVLALALTGGLLTTGVAWHRAAVLPRAAAPLLLLGTLGFLVSFFIAETLEPAVGQLVTAASGLALGAAFAAAGRVDMPLGRREAGR